MGTYVPRGQGGSVIVGSVYDNMGPDKGYATLQVEVTPQGAIAIKSGGYEAKRVMLCPIRAEQVIDLLRKGIDAAGEIDRLFADLKAQEKAGLERIYGAVKEGDE